MKKTITAVCMALANGALLAAPAQNSVVEGYPDWRGISPKSFIAGREITPSDLRHKATVVIEVDENEKVQSQLATAQNLVANLNGGNNFGQNWETLKMPRSAIAVVSVHGAKSAASFLDLLKRENKDQKVQSAIWAFLGQGCSIYQNLTFTGAPDTKGKRPYIYVMGPEGTEPAFKGELTDASVNEATAVVNKLKSQVEGIDWQPFYGSVKEPKFFPQIAQALEKGKTAKQVPLASVEKAIQKEIVSKDPEKAKEAQLLYDALVQTRSDLVTRIKMEVGPCPHRAAYDIQQLLKYWPSEKKSVEAASARIKSIPNGEIMAKIFCRAMEIESPDFVCKSEGDAKKIVAELNKAKKTLEKLKESKNMSTQNGALIIDMKLDELISTVPMKVPEK